MRTILNHSELSVENAREAWMDKPVRLVVKVLGPSDSDGPNRVVDRDKQAVSISIEDEERHGPSVTVSWEELVSVLSAGNNHRSSSLSIERL